MSVPWIVSCTQINRPLKRERERERARARETRKGPPVFSCAHYFQAPATQAIEIQIVWKLTPVQSPRITLPEKCLKTILLFESDNLISVKIKTSSRLKNVLSNFAILDQTRISSAKRDTVVATFHTRGAEGQQKAPLLSYFFIILSFSNHIYHFLDRQNAITQYFWG